MRGNDFLNKMENVDPAYVEAAEISSKKKTNTWVKWSAMAACLCLVIVASVFVLPKATHDTSNQVPDEPAEAIAFQMNGVLYSPITFDERKEFNLVPAEDIGLSKENTYIITDEDLGEQMGKIEQCANEALIGLPVYHFASWAEDDRICIINVNGAYAFYVRD